MTNNKFHLYQLQKIDSRLSFLQVELNKLSSQLESYPLLNEAQKNFSNVSNILKELTNQLAEVENQLSIKRVKLEQSESNLYQGRITNPKELQDLQKEGAILRNQLSILEETQLDILYQLERTQKDLNSATILLQNAKNENEITNRGIFEKINRIEFEKNKLSDERNAVISQISQELMAKYDDLAAKKKGIAISKIDDDACGVCGASLTPSEHQQAKNPTSLTYCPSCGRILYAD